MANLTLFRMNGLMAYWQSSTVIARILKLAKSDLLVKIIAVAVIVVNSQVTSRVGRNKLGSRGAIHLFVALTALLASRSELHMKHLLTKVNC